MEWGKHLVEMFIAELPQLVVPVAMGVVILWRQWLLEQHVDGRMEEFKGLLVEKGKLEGMREAIPLAREDRRELVEALKTPAPMPPVAAPPKEDPK